MSTRVRTHLWDVIPSINGPARCRRPGCDVSTVIRQRPSKSRVMRKRIVNEQVWQQGDKTYLKPPECLGASVEKK